MILPWLVGCSFGIGGGDLETFHAKDGDYFPEFISSFFDGTVHYTREFASIDEARSRVRLIEVKRLSQESSSGVNESNLSWSADGVYLSYETVNSQQRAIQIKDLKGNYTKDLTILPTSKDDFLNTYVMRQVHSYNAGLSWSRDSTRYAFMSNGGVGNYNIYVGGIDEEDQAVAPSDSKDGYASWSPVARELSFVSSRSGNGDIYLLNLANKSLARLSSDLGVDIFPVWAPDGNSIYYSGGDALKHSIYVLRREKGTWQAPVKMTNWREDDLRPTVSPNGRLLAFYSSHPGSRGKKWNIHVIETSEMKLNEQQMRSRVIATDVVVDLNTGPAWSPDGRKIFYVKRDAKKFNPIYAYNLYSGRAYWLKTKTMMNRDLMMSSLGVLSFRAQVGAWDRVFLALTNQGRQLQRDNDFNSRIHYAAL